jgi:very-short-patch-repair endonuclease
MTNHRRPPMATRALERARELRARSTDAERKLWSILSGGGIEGLKFRRQHSIPPYTVDFCCISVKLVIEVDGSQHTETSDHSRTQFLESKGFTVLRFWDNDVLMQIEAVAEAICRTVSPSPLTPTPLPSGEGL